MVQHNLGLLYAKGQGVPQDYAQAAKWYQKAAAQGYAPAQASLGGAYIMGDGMPQDFTQAAMWFKKAAAQGNPLAQFALGGLYATGNSVPQDDVRAYMWYSLVVEEELDSGDKLAAEKRDEIVRRMTPAQIAEAQRLTQQCQARQFKGC